MKTLAARKVTKNESLSAKAHAAKDQSTLPETIRWLVAGVALVGGGMFSIASDGECGGSSRRSHRQSIENLKPEGRLDPITASIDYQFNEADGDRKYKGKIWIVEGHVRNVTTVLDSIYVTVDTAAECEFSSSWRDRLAEIQRGQRIRAKCRCTGASVFRVIQMKDCVLLSDESPRHKTPTPPDASPREHDPSKTRTARTSSRDSTKYVVAPFGDAKALAKLAERRGCGLLERKAVSKNDTLKVLGVTRPIFETKCREPSSVAVGWMSDEHDALYIIAVMGFPTSADDHFLRITQTYLNAVVTNAEMKAVRSKFANVLNRPLIPMDIAAKETIHADHLRVGISPIVAEKNRGQWLVVIYKLSGPVTPPDTPPRPASREDCAFENLGCQAHSSNLKGWKLSEESVKEMRRRNFDRCICLGIQSMMESRASSEIRASALYNVARCFEKKKCMPEARRCFEGSVGLSWKPNQAFFIRLDACKRTGGTCAQWKWVRELAKSRPEK